MNRPTKTFLRLAPDASQAALVAMVAVAICFSHSSTASATIIRFDTIMGNVDVRLYSAATPLNVANFLNYVNNDRYDNSFIRRSVPGFVIQGGGYTYDVASFFI
jgi:peptidyl-prolyl cis-trans isomerase A (cyclophilin A)